MTVPDVKAAKERAAMLKRPWCCPEPRCEPVHQLANEEDLSSAIPGDSFVCFGQMPRGIEFIYDGIEHSNDLRSCSYTPLKGVIANQENTADWRLLADAYDAALAALRLVESPEEPPRV